MLVVDDLAGAPFRGLWWVFKEVANAVDRARTDDADGLMAQLQELYRQLEQGELDEATFDEKEAALLDALDALDTAEPAPETP